MKFKKSLISLLTVASLAAPIAGVVSCGSDSNKVGYIQMITDGAPIEDKSFNEQARDAAKDWGEANGKTWGATQSQGNSVSQLTAAFQSAVDAGSNVIVTTGFGTGNALVPFAKANPDKKFIMVDEDIIDQPNIASITYATEGAAFLAGIATGVMLNLNYDRFSADGLVVGAWGGQDIDPIWRFIGGWQQGLAYFNKNIAKDTAHMVKFTIPGSNRQSMISGSWDTGQGTQIATTLIKDKKADVIMGVAGSQSNDGVQVIKSLSSKSLSIGVDTDQTHALGDDGKYAFTSVQKDIYNTVKRALDVIISGKTDANIQVQHKNFGGLSEGFVKISEGLINNKSGPVTAGSGELKVSVSSADSAKLGELFAPSAITAWSLTTNQKSIYEISNLQAYKTVAGSATASMWSKFTGVTASGAQDYDDVAAKAEVQ